MLYAPPSPPLPIPRFPQGAEGAVGRGKEPTHSGSTRSDCAASRGCSMSQGRARVHHLPLRWLRAVSASGCWPCLVLMVLFGAVGHMGVWVGGVIRSGSSVDARCAVAREGSSIPPRIESCWTRKTTTAGGAHLCCAKDIGLWRL